MKKWFCSVIAVTIATAAFAANVAATNILPNPLKANFAAPSVSAPAPATQADQFAVRSDLEYLINNTLLGYELLPLLQAVPQENQILVTTAAAVRASLLAYEKQVTAQQTLSGKNAEIDSYLHQVPDVLNKIQQSSSEVETEMSALIGKLAKAVLRDTPTAQANEEVAVMLLASFAYQKALTDGSLYGRVSTVLQREMEESLESMME